MGIVGYAVQVALTIALCVVCFKLGQKCAWDYIAQNYIAIHKNVVLGPILIKRGGNKNEKHYTKRISKKTSK